MFFPQLLFYNTTKCFFLGYRSTTMRTLKFMGVYTIKIDSTRITSRGVNGVDMEHTLVYPYLLQVSIDIYNSYRQCYPQILSQFGIRLRQILYVIIPIYSNNCKKIINNYWSCYNNNIILFLSFIFLRSSKPNCLTYR